MSPAIAADIATSERVACFGRFMIDLPAGAEVAGHRSEFMFGMIQSERSSSDVKAFEKMMDRREEAIKHGENTDDYRLVAAHRPSITSRVFVSKVEAFGRGLYQIELHSLHRDVLFSLSQGPFNDKTIDRTVERLQSDLLPNLRTRASAEIPTDPGLCIEHGFIASDGSERARENTEIFLRFERWPELSLSVETSTIHKAEPSLLERIRSAEVPEEYVPLLRHIKTIREGRRDVGDYTGEESLEMVPTDAGYKLHSFRWESHFELNDPFRPMLVVELATGRRTGWVGKRPTISEQDAVELFDAVVNAIRLRPTTPAKPLTAPKAVLGTPLATGRSCPQSGVWQAEEGERRFVSEGDTMPAIQVAGKASFLDRLRGERPLERRATMWTLVAYEPDSSPGSAPASGDTTPT